MKIQSLEDLFVHELRDMYSAENQLIKALPKVAKNAGSSELKEALEQHLEETKHQAERLEQIFEQLDARAKGKKCHGMEGLIEEGKELMEEDAEEPVMDAGIIAACQKVEHYEMAAYGTLRTWAQQLGHDDIAATLQEILDEEKAADEKLNQIAQSMVNQEAAVGGEA